MADDPSARAGSDGGRMKVDHSDKSMEDMLAVFDLMADRILNGEGVTVAEMKRMSVAMGHVRVQLVDEVIKYEDSGLSGKGPVEHASLDLEKLRREIGGRLDRLRQPE